MQDIEPYYRWRDYYVAEDKDSPFYGRSTVNFIIQIRYTITIYILNGTTLDRPLYMRNFFADYDDGYAIMGIY